jgi:hypothetical protein
MDKSVRLDKNMLYTLHIDTSDVPGALAARVLYDRELDPPDDRCSSLAPGGDATVAPGFLRWGNLEFARDEDWQSIMAPASKKMLLALNVAGAAESARRNYDLQLWNETCAAPIAASYRSDPGGYSADRLLVDVTQDHRYRSQVVGRNDSDYETTAEADYVQSVWFGNLNAAVRLDYYTISYVPQGSYYAIRAQFSNRTMLDFQNLTFYFKYLRIGQTLLGATAWNWKHEAVTLDTDDPNVRGTGAILTMPNYLLCHQDPPSAACRLDEWDAFTLELRIGVSGPQDLVDDLDVYGTPLLELEAPAPIAAALGGYEADSFRLTGSPTAPVSTLYLPIVTKP